MSKSYSVYETKSKLSEILRLVKSGKEVIVNERGTPIAKILPFKEESSLEHRFQEMVQCGKIQAAERNRNLNSPLKKKDPSVLKRFLKERDE